VLLGLEGTAPNMRSPLGTVHSASGASSSISALGNSKWRAFRAHNALQVPADVGGLRMCLTRRDVEGLAGTCERLGLLDPGLDLLAEPGAVQPRELLEQRYAEQELFKRLLAGSGQEARQAVAWMEDYRAGQRASAPSR